MQSKILDYISWDNHHESGIIRVDYSLYALNQTQNIKKFWIQDQAVKRRYEEWISIDGIESLDLDDAIWVEKTKKWYVVFVHISDVTEAVEKFSPLDIEALKRTTSVYRSQEVLNMFPPALSQNLLSLNEHGEKLTLSMKIHLDINGEIDDFEVYESVFQNKKRYNYEDFVDDYLNPDSEFHETLQLMYEIARKRRPIRKREWANIDFQDADRQLSIWIHEEKEHFSRKKIPSTIIEEFMILANIAAASLCVKHNYNSIFRAHKSFEERAFYQNGVGYHMGLALPNYTHFTSPIRRYADMVVHRVLKLIHLRGEKEPYSIWEISDISEHINISREVIDILWSDLDRELRAYEIISKLQQKNGENLNISHFTQHIRETVSLWKKMPKIMVWKFINDLENWNKSNWAWSIGVLLVSRDEEIKQTLKKVLIDDEKFSAKAILSLLSVTKITRTDPEYLFDIKEVHQGNQFTIEVYFRWKMIASTSGNYKQISLDEFEEDNPYQKDMIGMIRKKTLKKIIKYFCGK